MQVTERTAGSQAIGALLVALVGVGLVVYGLWFIIQNFKTLIEIGLSPDEVGKTGEQIRTFSPGVYNYISHVQVALGGFIAATGVAIAFMAWYGVRRGESWAWWGVVITTVAWVAIATPFHYVYGFGTLAHLGPTYFALAFVAIGGYLTRPWR
ncbi:MAG: hypothetical protein HY675_05050 [Chloroflexi bacterium]|nr:hypothetical protein [Chloroflexota bacterium]